ncbi:V-type immunoglobulin domain-containing suppressor of T-cell activation isoform X2 [Dromaius novaehollandiae]|uniref:V-type immunoglobulin domain-containing suppressor of T-cell activation isoform X2 n=1 Tax=Dromaius novaehollandiae TaxID=8790 RepID=UPI00311E8B4A
MEATPGPGGLLAALCLLAAHGRAAALVVTAPYALCVCPAGHNVTLTCRVAGPLADRHDLLYKTWYFSSNGDQSCSDKTHIRNVTEKELHRDLAKHRGPPANATGRAPHGEPAGRRGVELLPDHHGAFHIVVTNLTPGDSGNYCCYAVEARREHGKPHTLQVAHGVVELQIRQGRGAPQNCTFHTATSKDITAAALATGACIVGILCLPLILLLIYKQRQAVSNRRAHELVRMESAQGIENPVFEAAPSTETWPRAPLAYAPARHTSESGRHLLAEPSTPLSPPGPGDCFFPTLEPVPDSPSAPKA